MSQNGKFSLSAVKLRFNKEADKKELEHALINGYKQTAEYNKEYAEMCLSADNEALALCEEKLSESE